MSTIVVTSVVHIRACLRRAVSLSVYEFEVIIVMLINALVYKGWGYAELPFVTVGEKVAEFISLRF